LYVEKGPGAGQLIPVKQGALIIGRASICDLRLQHPSISRRHAQLTRQGDRFTLKDLGSQNGTFVNRVKIIGDLEIRIGDEIALGNALLKLRGSGVPPEKTNTAPAVQGKKKGRKKSSLTRVAIGAAAVGSAAAALLTVAVLKFTSSTQQPSTTTLPSSEGVPPVAAEGDTPVTAEGDVPVMAQPSQEQELEYEPPPPASDEEIAAAPGEDLPRATKTFKADEEAEEPAVKKSSGPSASALGAKASASRKEKGKSSRASRESAKDVERQEASRQESLPPQPAVAQAPVPAEPPAPQVDRADVIALYEKGDVAGALSLARSGKLEPLAAKLSEYQSSIASGQQALHERETTLAIRHLSNALAVDQELSQGWAAQASKLRRQLGRLYTQLGQDQIKAGAFADARTSFETALKYDPNNTWARSELQDLGPIK
jgi:pSer/pThr/pTyr-binding forkhead associated (FHA) protein